MSNFATKGRLKGGNYWRNVIALDNYFGRHEYGYIFCDDNSDTKVYREYEIEFKELK